MLPLVRGCGVDINREVGGAAWLPGKGVWPILGHQLLTEAKTRKASLLVDFPQHGFFGGFVEMDTASGDLPAGLRACSLLEDEQLP
ncbi:hypothetical protein SAMN04488580_101530 [Mycobacterium sp. 283mftsu]|nr:hypothetical protein SAMN04488580_101530 [Mycobacterium sp. 283mftsu]